MSSHSPTPSMASTEDRSIQMQVQDVPFRRSIATHQWTTSPLVSGQSAPRHHRKSRRPESSHQRLAAARESSLREQAAARTSVMRVGGEGLIISIQTRYVAKMLPLKSSHKTKYTQ